LDVQGSVDIVGVKIEEDLLGRLKLENIVSRLLCFDQFEMRSPWLKSNISLFG
jgi:hypothetical protein